MQRIRLNVLGLSYSQAQTGAYALILSDDKDERRIPIVIGAAEAQSIAIIMEKMVTPRPLTHDLFKTFADAFAVGVLEVIIYHLEAGIFYSEIVCKRKKQTLKIDARTSDAVALALRFKCPIYTSSEILDKAGISMSEKKGVMPFESEIGHDKPEEIYPKSQSSSVYSGYTIEQLKALLEEAVSSEDYERASYLRDEIDRREK